MSEKILRGSGSRLSLSVTLLPIETMFSSFQRGPYYGIKHRLLTHKEAWRQNKNRRGLCQILRELLVLVFVQVEQSLLLACSLRGKGARIFAFLTADAQYSLFY